MDDTLINRNLFTHWKRCGQHTMFMVWWHICFCFWYVLSNVGNPLIDLRISYITIINPAYYSCYYCCWYSLSHGKYLLPCNFIERDIPWNQLFCSKELSFYSKYIRSLSRWCWPHIALIIINDTTKN